MLKNFIGFGVEKIYISKGFQEKRRNPLNFETYYLNPCSVSMAQNSSSSVSPLKYSSNEQTLTHKPMFDPHNIDANLIQEIGYDALVWSSLHGLIVGDRASQKSGRVPGVGIVHAPIALFPMPFPESHWNQACEVAPIFNELIDRVSLDAKFIQESLFRTKKVDAFTSRLLDIHRKMLDMNKKEELEAVKLIRDGFTHSYNKHGIMENGVTLLSKLNRYCRSGTWYSCGLDIRLGLHRSDYMLDEQTNLLLQIELNTISSSFPGLSCLVSELHRSLLHRFKQHLALDPERIPQNNSVIQFAEALYKAWSEYNNTRAVIMVVVQTEERNMYDQHWLFTVLKERYQVRSIRKSLAEINVQGELLPDGTLVVDGEPVAVSYFRAGYAPNDYPSESEWNARLLIEQSCAIKCPSIAYHLAGTKKIQQELAKPNQLERFLENKDDIAKIRKCFAGLWSLDDMNIVKDAIERPGLYVMKPQREGGGNNIYGGDVRLALQRMEKEGTAEDAAYILMQRIFPTISPAVLMREGISHKEHVISELGIYATYLRNKNKVIMNNHSGYLMRTKVSSSNEGGVAAGFAVLDSIYLV